MPGDAKIHVLIAHGNPLVSAGLEAAFRAQEDLELSSCAPEDVLESTAGVAPSLVAVTDLQAGIRLLSLPDGSRCRVLIVTDDDRELSIRRAVELGARGYLSLSSRVEIIKRAIRTIHDGGTVLDPFVMAKIAVSLASRPLTHRQMEVLRLMMKGLPDKAIARALKRSVNTVKAHVKEILSRLDVRSRAEAVAVARQRGLIPDESLPTFPHAPGFTGALLETNLPRRRRPSPISARIQAASPGRRGPQEGMSGRVQPPSAFRRRAQRA